MSTHTPGPWKAIEWSCHAPTTVMAGFGTVVAECSGHGRHSDECLTDARLIAAAPDFYEACLGDEVPELTRLSALRALINEVSRLGLANDEDPEATTETLSEVRQLFEMLQAAIRKVGESPAKEGAA